MALVDITDIVFAVPHEEAATLLKAFLETLQFLRSDSMRLVRKNHPYHPNSSLKSWVISTAPVHFGRICVHTQVTIIVVAKFAWLELGRQLPLAPICLLCSEPRILTFLVSLLLRRGAKQMFASLMAQRRSFNCCVLQPSLLADCVCSTRQSIAANPDALFVPFTYGVKQGETTFARVTTDNVHRTVRTVTMPLFSDSVCPSCRTKFAYTRNAYATPELWTNLFHNDNPLKFRKSILCEPLNAVDISYAVVLKIAMVKTRSNDVEVDINDMLKAHFSRMRLLRTGDVFSCMPTSGGTSSFTFALQDNGGCLGNLFWFKVVAMEPSDSDSLIVYSTHSTLFQVANIQCSVPRAMEYIFADRLGFGVSQWLQRSYPRLPGLHAVVAKLLALFCSFASASKLGSKRQTDKRGHAVLLSAPSGAGKHLVVERSAQILGWNTFVVDCFDLWSESSGSTETKMASLMKQSVSISPVVVIVKSIDCLGKENNGELDAKIIAKFRALIEESASSAESGFVVVATSRQARNLPAELLGCFTHHVQIAPHSGGERTEMISCLFGKEVGQAAVQRLVQRTAGFWLADLLLLHQEAHFHCFNRMSKLCPFRDREQHFADAKFSLTEPDIEAALHDMLKSQGEAIGAPKVPAVQWTDIGGLGEAKKVILDTIDLALQHPELFGKGIKRSGILLYGPPGCGKTMLAKAVATECSLNFLSVKGPELLNMYVGQSEQNVRQVFEQARSAAPCVIFFDELDALAPSRGRSGDSGGVMDRVVSQLLTELDGLESNQDLFVIGATNRPDLIDSSLLRPGRFEKLVLVSIGSDRATQLQVLKAATKKLTLAKDVDFDVVLDRCPSKLSGADFAALAVAAVTKALARLVAVTVSEEGQKPEIVVTQEDLLTAAVELTPSVSEDDWSHYAALQKRLS